MKRVKHILVVIALMLGTLPGTHAVEYGQHDHEHDAPMEICAAPVHTCDCHSCDGSASTEEIQAPQYRPASSSLAGVSPAFITLFTLTENKPVFRHRIPVVAGILPSIQTVQLLI